MKKVLISWDDIREICERYNYNSWNGPDYTHVEDWFNSQPPAPQWVSGKEPPEIGKSDCDNTVIVRVRFYNEKMEFINIMEGWHDHTWPEHKPGTWVICNPPDHTGFNFEVTHWMPIPPLPECEK